VKLRELWIEIDESIPAEPRDILLKSAAEVCDVILVSAEDVEEIRKTGAKVAASADEADIYLLPTLDEDKVMGLKKAGKTVAVRIDVREKADEEAAISAARFSADYVIVHCPGWKVIPLENLISKVRGKSKLLAGVSSAKEARLALESLELGVDGVVLKTSSLDELVETVKVTKGETSGVHLAEAKIIESKEIGTGARACVDTCDLMKSGEGMLVGCQSSGLFLVQAEVHENPFVDTRPFRVNAGPLSLYVLSSPTKTRYLSELKAGDEILVVDRKGKTRPANVARVKIELRPMMLIEAECEGKRIKTIVQNAETIRLVTKEGSESVTGLKAGDKILVYMVEGGRHFGTLVKDEMVIER
jgi:3-dehydroquinate synthase II